MTDFLSDSLNAPSLSRSLAIIFAPRLYRYLRMLVLSPDFTYWGFLVHSPKLCILLPSLGIHILPWL